MKRNFYLSIVVFSTVLFNTVNSHAQVSTDSLILDMPMNGDVLDYSGNNNNGTMHNIVADTNRFGTPSNSYRFNGSDSYIEIPASPSMNMIHTTNEVTITAWININNWYDNWNVFSILERYNPNTDAGWLFEANWASGGILFLADETNASNWAGCDFTWEFDRWYHVGLTYSQSESVANFYVDGVNVCSEPYTADINIADNTSSFIVGRSLAGPDEYSDGNIDDLKIYYRALSSDEVDTLFTVSVKEKRANNDFACYPNPASDRITITTMPGSQSSYIITDVMGRVFIKGKVNSEVTNLNVQHLPSGLYFLQLEDGRQPARRFIKQ